MSKPKAYDPQEGYQYQILARNQSYDRAWDHCDYAVNRADKNYLLGEYRLAYGGGWEFQTILLPRKYWPKKWESTLVATKEQVEAILAGLANATIEPAEDRMQRIGESP